MALKKVAVELPEELWKLAGLTPKKASAQVREILVMDLVRQAKISQGRAAELLGLDRWELMDLMGKYEVPSGPRTVDELQAELARWRRRRKSPP
jgi:predicted HTH domain antitoxin